MTSDTPTLTEATPATPVAEGIEPAPRRQRADARRRRAQQLLPLPAESLEPVAHDRLEQGLTGGEVAVHGADPDAGPPGAALTEFLRAQLEHSGDCRGLAASVMISALDRGEGEPTYCEALQQTGAALLARAQDAGEIRRDTDIDDLVRMVNAIGMATEESPERADRLFALMMDGLRVEDS